MNAFWTGNRVRGPWSGPDLRDPLLNCWENRLAMKARHIVTGVYLTALLFVWAWFCGAMVRREMSPWVWEDYPLHVRKHGQGDALFAVALYLLFYSGGFAFPFVIVRGIA